MIYSPLEIGRESTYYIYICVCVNHLKVFSKYNLFLANWPVLPGGCMEKNKLTREVFTIDLTL